MKENLLYYLITIAVIAVVAVCFTVFSQEDDYIVSFLEGYGYKVSARPVETVRIAIPSPLDAVYTEYNLLQQRAGFDLREYEGKDGIRYTYEVQNYPGGIDGVRANVLVIDGEIAGGDICTLKIDGFMHEICEIGLVAP